MCVCVCVCVISSNFSVLNYRVCFFFPIKLLCILAPPFLFNNSSELSERLPSQAIVLSTAME